MALKLVINKMQITLICCFYYFYSALLIFFISKWVTCFQFGYAKIKRWVCLICIQAQAWLMEDTYLIYLFSIVMLPNVKGLVHLKNELKGIQLRNSLHINDYSQSICMTLWKWMQIKSIYWIFMLVFLLGWEFCSITPETTNLCSNYTWSLLIH